MTFTYDGTLDTGVEKVRFELGDTNSATALFTDEEIQFKLNERAGVILVTAADLCDVLATRFAGDYDFEWRGGPDVGSKFNRSQAAKAYAERAKALRSRAGGGLTTVGMTRVDGRSDSLSARDRFPIGDLRGYCYCGNPDCVGCEVDEYP